MFSSMCVFTLSLPVEMINCQSDLAVMKAQYQAGFQLQGEKFPAGEKKTYTSKIMTGFCILLPIFMKSSLHAQG